MRRARHRALVVVSALALHAISYRPAAAQTIETSAVLEKRDRALLNRYCVACHNERQRTAGLALDRADLTAIGDQAAVWEKVVRKLRAGLMPPAGRPRPDGAVTSEFVTRVENALDDAWSRRPNPGRTDTFHRLNRREYQNAVRDLLGVEVDVASLLPADDATYGFDNIASALKVSPTLMERYLAAARKVSRLALGSLELTASMVTYRVPSDLSQEAHIDGLPLGTRGGMVVEHTFPLDGEYVIHPRLAIDTQDNIPRYDDADVLEVTVDGARVGTFTLPGEPDSEELKSKRFFDDFNQAGARRHLDADWRVRVPVKAGRRRLTVAFLGRTNALTEMTRINAFRPERLALKESFERPYVGGFFNEETRTAPYLASVSISGPFGSAGAGDTPSRQRILACRPTGADDGSSCAQRNLEVLARRAYRRPVTPDDVRGLLTFYDEGRQRGGFEGGMEAALRRLLTSPDFLFRIERAPAGLAPHTPYKVGDLSLASRLSFFLWSSIPDDELLDVAGRGGLSDRATLERQVRRMLADPRSQAFFTNFAGQWLYLRNLPAVTPDLRAFPDFDESLRQGMRRETELFFESVVREDRSALDLLTADYTFVNERLATHYGMPNVKGSHFRRVTLVDDYRRGLLGKAAILAVTSYPNRTSPVVRGKWILENLLGTPPPPPPPNVPDLTDRNADGKVMSMRERMVQHRANPVCASCHAMMDPPGLSLENFDAIGRWRRRSESFGPIDASGVLPDGTTFDGVKGLREALLARSPLIMTTLTEKLLTYALGRGLEVGDAPAVRTIVREAAKHDYRFSALLLGVVQSPPFQLRSAS